MLTPALTYDLRLLGEGAEPSNRCRSVLSHLLGPRGLGLSFWRV
jgi:hypothetical protein